MESIQSMIKMFATMCAIIALATILGVFICTIGFILVDFISGSHHTNLQECTFYGFFVGIGMLLAFKPSRGE